MSIDVNIARLRIIMMKKCFDDHALFSTILRVINSDLITIALLLNIDDERCIDMEKIYVYI